MLTLVLLHLVARCSAQAQAQADPCAETTRGSCVLQEDAIINTYQAEPTKCDQLCRIVDRCEFWRARWDGAECSLLAGDYHQGCGSFAGPIGWRECSEGPESCSAYTGDTCIYTGDRLAEDEPSPGDVSSPEECELWAALWTDQGAAYFHYLSDTGECRLYSTLASTCEAVGGPRAAPALGDCSHPGTTTETSSTSTTAPATTTTAANQGLVISGGWPDSRTVEVFPATSCSPPPLPTGRRGHTMTIVGASLVTCGGDSSSTSTSCISWVGGEEEWQQYATLREERGYHTAWSHQGQLLLLGGQDSPGTGEVVGGGGSTFPMEHPAGYSCAADMGGAVAVIGGIYSSSLSNVDRYDMSGYLGSLPHLRTARYYHACGAVADSTGHTVLIVAGGWDSSGYLSSVEVLEHGATSWVAGPELPRALYRLSGGVAGGRLQVTGGRDSSNNERSEIYELVYSKAEKGWTQVGTMEEARARHAVAAVNLPALCGA